MFDELRFETTHLAPKIFAIFSLAPLQNRDQSSQTTNGKQRSS